MRWLLLLFLVSCNIKTLKPTDTKITRTSDYQQQIDELIARDAENKRWARIYLHEIDQAIMNDDMPAYVFFIGQFEQIPLEIVPHEFRDEPGYVSTISPLELHFRLRWFEQAIKIYLQESNSTH